MEVSRSSFSDRLCDRPQDAGAPHYGSRQLSNHLRGDDRSVPEEELKQSSIHFGVRSLPAISRRVAGWLVPRLPAPPSSRSHTEHRDRCRREVNPSKRLLIRLTVEAADRGLLRLLNPSDSGCYHLNVAIPRDLYALFSHPLESHTFP